MEKVNLNQGPTLIYMPYMLIAQLTILCALGQEMPMVNLAMGTTKNGVLIENTFGPNPKALKQLVEKVLVEIQCIFGQAIVM